MLVWQAQSSGAAWGEGAAVLGGRCSPVSTTPSLGVEHFQPHLIEYFLHCRT